MQWLLETSCYFDLPVISWVFATVPYCRSIDGSNSLHFFALNWNRYTVLVWGNEAQLCHLMLCECIVFFCKHQSSNNRRWICSASSTIVFKVWDVFGVCTRTTLSILHHIFLRCTGRWMPRHVIRASSKFCVVWLCPIGHGAWQKRLVLDEARALIFSVPLSSWGNLHDKSWKIIWWL